MGYDPSESTHLSLGMTGYLYGCRPTALMGWNDPDDWQARLEFDMRIADLIWQKVISKAMQHGRYH